MERNETDFLSEDVKNRILIEVKRRMQTCDGFAIYEKGGEVTVRRKMLRKQVMQSLTERGIEDISKYKRYIDESIVSLIN
jgi:hypothetical protein